MHNLRVGLYGDSFGTGSLPKINDNYDIGFNYHWSKLLERHYNCHITNYAVSGASIYYCYRQFMDTHHLNDINIFLITSPARCNHEIEIKSVKHRIVNQSHLESYYNINLSDEELHALNEIKVWFKLLDVDQDVDMCDLMMEKIHNTRPTTIFVPCLEWAPSFIKSTDNHLYSLYVHQMKNLGMDTHKVIENTKWISGHLTPEYNKLCADLIISRIDTGNWDKWVIPTIEFGPNKDEYFVSTT